MYWVCARVESVGCALMETSRSWVRVLSSSGYSSLLEVVIEPLGGVVDSLILSIVIVALPRVVQ